MSRLTTSPLFVLPSAANGTSVSGGGSPWVSGDWVPFIAVTEAVDTAIAGVVIQNSTAWSQRQMEVEFGIGPEDAEVPIGHIRISGPSSGNGGPTVYMIPYPISGIPVATRVCMRIREHAGGAFTAICTLLYYEDLDSDQAIPYTTSLLTSIPAGSDSISLTPSATPWAESDWEEFDPAVGDPTYIVGVAPGNPTAGVDWEIDLGIGAAASEVALTTFRGSTYGSNVGRFNFANLPGLMPVTAGSRLAACLRKSGTATTTVPVAFLAYVGELPEPPTNPVIGPIAWVELSRRVP